MEKRALSRVPFAPPNSRRPFYDESNLVVDPQI
jgi:hypothetical protein